MTPVQIIKKAYGSIKRISDDTGLNYETLRRNRLTDDRIGSMTFSEWWAILRHGDFSDDEILKIAKWRAGSE